MENTEHAINKKLAAVNAKMLELDLRRRELDIEEEKLAADRAALENVRREVGDLSPAQRDMIREIVCGIDTVNYKGHATVILRGSHRYRTADALEARGLVKTFSSCEYRIDHGAALPWKK